MNRFRFTIVLLALLGCTPAAPVPAVPPPAEVPAVQAADTAGADTILVCVLHGGKMLNVRAELLPSGDTVVGGRPFSAVYADTGQYAATREWYVNNEPIDYDPESICFVKYGLPRVLSRDSVVRLGEWRGVPVFRERYDGGGTPLVFYVPVRAGCEFQPYQTEAITRPPSCPEPYQFSVP